MLNLRGDPEPFLPMRKPGAYVRHCFAVAWHPPARRATAARARLWDKFRYSLHALVVTPGERRRVRSCLPNRNLPLALSPVPELSKFPFARRVFAAAILPGILVLFAGCGEGGSGERGERPPAPVEVAEVERGEIRAERVLSGTLSPSAEFVAAAKIAGRVRGLRVDLADPVEKGQVIATLEDEEYQQQVRQAEAEVAVAEAARSEAEARAATAAKEAARVRRLMDRGIASESQQEEAEANQLASAAALEVARATVTRAKAALEGARIRLGYTRVRADWADGGGERFVAERMVDEGDTVSANEGLFRIVAVNPLRGVVSVTERDYPRIGVGQPVEVFAEAFPGRAFEGRITRIAPVFSEESRQARVEFAVENEEKRLKPGMFVRVTMVLEVREDAAIVPDSAIVRRDDQTGVFRLEAGGTAVSWEPVEIGIRQGSRIELVGAEPTGRVVVLGQQLVEDGSSVSVTENTAAR